ncbi:MAG: ATP synthase F1 subunit gamma, partial [Deltaproteobacteria bacterium]|nr:ATP synthase F1 subunit gamma [Deltaproteobacteria bacterium]
MPDLKAIRRRIGSVRSTQQITRAMEMVAAAKLRRAQDELLALRPYTRKLSELLGQVARASYGEEHPLLSCRPRRSVLVLGITSDRGLCGGFNINVVNRLRALFRQEEQQAAEPALVLLGRKGTEQLKRDPLRLARRFPLPDPPKLEAVQELAAYFIDTFQRGEADTCLMAFNRFVNAVQQQVVVEPLLPVQLPAAATALPTPLPPVPAAEPLEYVYEPHPLGVLELLLPRYVEARLHWALLESRAAEQGARMAAMQGANRNAEQMIERLTLEYNKARQATITKELLE